MHHVTMVTCLFIVQEINKMKIEKLNQEKNNKNKNKI